MAVKKEEQDKQVEPAHPEGEASSGPRAKGATDDLQILVAQLRQRTEGLDAHEVEEEIDRFFEKMIARHAKVVPEQMRGEHRALLLGMLEQDPTLRAMREDLRRNLLPRK